MRNTQLKEKEAAQRGPSSFLTLIEEEEEDMDVIQEFGGKTKAKRVSCLSLFIMGRSWIGANAAAQLFPSLNSLGIKESDGISVDVIVI